MSTNILILVTGSIAAVKVGLLLDQLSIGRYHIRIAATKSAFHFLNRMQKSNSDPPVNRILTDDQEWREWQEMNDAVMHIELRRWAHLVVIAPLDANTLAKLSTGLCDNLVTCVMRAWEVKQKPVILCPAMNTAMWTHPVTVKQLNILKEWYSLSSTEMQLNCNTENENDSVTLPNSLEEAMFQIIMPVKKRLACGDIGIGGMASVEDIAKAIERTANLISANYAEVVTTEPNIKENDKKDEEEEEKLALPQEQKDQ